MKTNKIIAAALLPLMFACTKENIGQTQVENGKYDVTISVSPDETKAYMDETHGLLWQTGDYYAGIVKDDKNLKSNSLSNVYPYPNVEGNPTNQASFSWSSVELGDYKFYYPYDYASNSKKLVFGVPLHSVVDFGNSNEIFAAVSKDKVTLVKDESHGPNISAETKYKVVGSYIRIAVYGKPDETVSNIHIKGSPSSLHGQYFINPENNEVSGYDLNGDDILLDFKTLKKAEGSSKDDANAVYVPVLPGKSSKNTYTVATNKGFYKFESASELEFKNGAVYDIPLNLSSPKAQFSAVPEKLYIVGDATVAGWNLDKAIELTKADGENKFIAKNISLATGCEGFKFLTSPTSWFNAYVNVDGKLTYYYNPDAVGKDIKFTVDKSGIYDLTVNFDDCSLTADLVIEYPRVLSYNKSNTYYMTPTAVENEYKATAYLGQGDGAHDFFIYQGEEAYHEAGFKQIAFPSDSEGYSGTVTKDTNTGLGWWISDDNRQTNRLYDITLNTATNKVTVKFAQGTNFWLIGSPFGGYNAFNKPDEFKATVDENGVAKWNVTTSGTGDFKICGEHTLSNAFYDGEWYYSTATYGNFNWSWDTGNNYSTDTEVKEFDVKAFIPNGADYKWSLNETGTFEIVFDTKNLKIKIYKTK